MKPSTLYFSPSRLWTIARNTMTEVARQKFFYIFVVFGIVVVISSQYFSQFSMRDIDHTKFIKDFCLAAIKVFGSLIAIVGTAQLLPMELENRTIYPILAKPVYRAEFLFGKFTGMITLLFFTTVIMTLIFAGVLYYTERSLVTAIASFAKEGRETQDLIRDIVKQTRDPAIFKAIALIYVQLVLICSLSLLIGTFATSVIFNVITTVMIYLCGHLEGVARASLLGGQTLMDTSQAFFSKLLLLVIALFVPDLSAFDVVDSVITGQVIPMIYVWKTMGYGFFYSAIVLVVAQIIFEWKEI